MIKQVAAAGSSLQSRTIIQPLHIAVVCSDQAWGLNYNHLLTAFGHQVCVVQDSRQLLEFCRNVRPDLVIAEVDLAQRTILDICAEVWREWHTPCIVIIDPDGHDHIDLAADTPLFGCLTKPVTPKSLAVAIAIAMNGFGTMRKLSEEVLLLRQTLEDRKVVERAKGMVIKYLGLEEEEAYIRLRRLASNQNHKLVDVAKSIIAAGDCFRQLEQCTTARSASDDQARRPHGPDLR